MCENCGCSDPVPSHDHDHELGHEHGHEHSHDHEHPRTLDIRESLLAENDRLAERNRGFFKAKSLLVINILSAPGSGKTSLIERTLADRRKRIPTAVIVGDLQTENDANRIRAQGAPAVQITTGETCHLDAHMVAHALDNLDLDGARLLFIENVGNLVCPAAFDLGENLRAVVLSVTEGEDKPLKYPAAFFRADAIIISKTDLAEATSFNRQATLENIRQINPRAAIFELSARTGAGMEKWYQFLEDRIKLIPSR